MEERTTRDREGIGTSDSRRGSWVDIEDKRVEE